METAEKPGDAHKYLVLNTVTQMIQAQALAESDKYYILFENSLQLVVNELEPAMRQAIQIDYNNLRTEIQRIDKSQENTETIRSKIRKLKEDFATTHKYFVMIGLGKLGFHNTSEEGLIDFGKMDITQITKIIRSHDGLGAKVKEVAEEGKTVTE